MARSNSPSAPALKCPECGNPLDSGSPEGLCRRCLVNAVLKMEEQHAVRSESSGPILGRVGPYEIIERIGRGGMGEIYRAHQPALSRDVAIKLIPEGKLAGGKDVERFRIEVTAVAELDHPNIVPIFDVGEDDGHCYYSMPLIEGGSVASRVAALSPNYRATATLIETVARAIHHAHQRGILHRDIKPSNILFTAGDEPVVIDFGLAKRLDPGLEDLTQTGELLGSPAYVAPEIISGTGNASVGSDIYSLGTVLYQLLVGQIPFSGTSQIEVLRNVVETEPVRPTQVNAKIPADLETICMKCLNKAPEARYVTAGELADDLRSWLDGRVIQARPAAAVERVSKWIKRRPALAALCAVSAIGAATMLIVLGISSQRIRSERDFALEEKRSARRASFVSDTAAAFAALERGNLRNARELLMQCQPAGDAHDFRDFAWRFAFSRAVGGEQRGWLAHQDEVSAITYKHTSAELITGSGTGRTIKFWNYDLGSLGRSYPDALGESLSYRLKREAYIALGRGDRESRLQLVPSVRIGQPNSLTLVEKGRYLLVGGGGEFVRIFDLKTDEMASWRSITYGMIATISGRDHYMIGGGADSELRGEGRSSLYETNKSKPVLELPDSGGIVAVSHDGSTMVTGSRGGRIFVWNPDGTPRRTHDGSAFARDLAVSSRGSHVAAACRDHTEVFLWSKGSEALKRLWGHKATVRKVAFADDGIHLFSAADDQSIIVWNAQTGKRVKTLIGHTAPVTAIRWLPERQELVSGSLNGEVKIWEPLRSLHSWRGLLHAHAISEDGMRLAGGSGGEVKIVRVSDGKEGIQKKITAAGEEVLGMRFLADDSQLAVLVSSPKKRFRSGAVLHFLDASTLLPADEPLRLPDVDAIGFAIAPDEERVAIALKGSEALEVWELPSRVRRGRYGDAERFFSYGLTQFTKDGRYIVSRDWNQKTVEIHAADDASLVRSIPAGRVGGLALSPDGKWLALGLSNGSIQMWDMLNYEQVGEFSGHLRLPEKLLFSPDSNVLLSTSGVGFVRLWHLPTLREIGIYSAWGSLQSLYYSKAEQAVVATDYHARTDLWPVPSLTEIEAGLENGWPLPSASN